ncbi:MAG: ATP-binding protein [Pelagimonas sp.]|jgi:serine/threonine-protein kinase RsbW|nr:ATP-binding protein [Pelagimonas sp.]
MEAQRSEDGTVSISCTLASTPEAVRETLIEVHKALSEFQFKTASGDVWEIALVEAMNNIVEHAYADQDDGEIAVSLEFSPTAVDAKFTDYGVPMPGGQAPAGTPANVDVPLEDLPEGGFGWFLIRSLSSKLEYSREDHSNHLHLEIPVSS